MRIHPTLAFLIFVLLVSFPLFGHLDVIPMQIWDESRVADQAMEMIRSHNWLIPTYRNEPDMWMTKPPMLVWLQILCMKIVGYNEYGIRLPSALAALGLCLILFWLFAKKAADPFTGLITVIVLITIPGYVINHGTRTGEYDSLLTFFMAAYAISFFLYCEENKRKYLSITFVFLILACLTKGIQGLVFLPALFIYAIYKKKVASTFKAWQFYAGVAGFFIFVVGYYLLREHYNPGFLKTMQENEIGGRYSKTVEGHEGNAWDYFNQLINTYFTYWYLLVIPGVLTGIYSKEVWIRNLTIFSTLVAGIYLAVLSNGQTKVYWYLLPLYPFLAIIVAVFLYTACKLLASIDIRKIGMSHNVLPYAFLLMILLTPYLNICKFVAADISDVTMNEERYNMQKYLQGILHSHDSNNDNSVFLTDGLAQDLEWYFLVFEQEKRPIFLKMRDQIAAGQKVVAYLPETKQYIAEHFNSNIIYVYKNVAVYMIESRKVKSEPNVPASEPKQ